MERKNRFYLLLSLPPLVVTLLIFVFPLVLVTLKIGGGAEELFKTLKSPYTWSLFSFTFLQALLSAVISVLLALPFASFFSSYTFPGRRLTLALADTAFVLPSIIVVLGFVIWYGNNGILNTLLSRLTDGRVQLNVLYSYKAVILAHVYLNFPLSFSLLTGGMTAAGDREERAASFLGASRIRIFFTVTLEKIKGTVYQTLLLVFLFCFPSFLIVMTLGGSPKYYTVEAEIYRRAYMDGDLSSSSSLALVSFLVMTVILLITGIGRREKKIQKKQRTLRKAKGGKKALALLLVLLVALFMLPPLLSIVYRAFFTKDGEFTLRAWEKIFSSGDTTAISAVIVSVLIALLSSLVATAMATALAVSSVRRKRRFTALLSSLPIAAGSVTLGLGFSYLSSLLYGGGRMLSLVLTLLAHITVVLPFAIRAILPGAGKLSERLLYSSLSLSPSYRKNYRKVEVPLLRSYRRKAFAFSFALSLGETNATMALGNGDITTLPILIYRKIQHYDYQGASALCLILLVISLIIFAFSERGGEKSVIS